MNQRLASYLLYAAMVTIDVIAFSTTSSILLRTNAALSVKNNLPSAQRESRYAPLFSSPESATETEEVVDDYDVTCYVVNDEEIITEGEKPHVVCTSEPEEVSTLTSLFHPCDACDLFLTV